MRAFTKGAALAPNISHDFFFELVLPSANFKRSAGDASLSISLRKANAYWGSSAVRRFNSSNGGLVSWDFSSSKGTFSSRAASLNMASDGLRRPSSTSDQKGAEQPSFFA